MRYVPKLIPRHARVLEHYFKGSLYDAARPNRLYSLFSWLLGLFFLLSALAFIFHPPVFLLSAGSAALLLPPGRRIIERIFRFRLKPGLQFICVSILSCVTLPLMAHYMKVDRILAQEQRQQQELAAEKLAAENAEKARQEAQRKDSLNFYLQQSDKALQAHQTELASEHLSNAFRLTADQTERAQIHRKELQISVLKTQDMVKAGKFEAALPELDRLLREDPSNKDLSYSKALCCSKTDRMQEAVATLRPLLRYGHPAAEKLHERINPLRRRITGYITRCCDGTISYATGRGACSHHGGVCDWNEPRYEQYRNY